MADAISIQELIDARTDAKTLEEAVNGDAVTTVLSRLGETYPTLSNALNQIDSKLDSADAQIKLGITNLFENGGLPATPFKTKALMTASSLANDKYAMVTDDTANNGLYIKTAGAWVKSAYDPVTLAATDATTKANNAKTQAVADSKIYTDTKTQENLSLVTRLNSIPADVSRVIIREGTTSQPDFGALLGAPYVGTNANIATYVYANPAINNITIKRMSFVSNVAGSVLEIRAYSRVGDVFTPLRSLATVTTKNIGYNDFLMFDFAPFALNAGEYIGVVVNSTGGLAYGSLGTTAYSYTTISTAFSPFTKAVAGKEVIKFAFYESSGANSASVFFDSLSLAAKNTDNLTEVLTVDTVVRLGLQATPSIQTTSAGVGHWLVGKPSPSFGVVNSVDMFTLSAGDVEFGVYRKIDVGKYVRIAYVGKTLLEGLNTVSLSLTLEVGDFLGIKNITTKIAYKSTAEGHDGYIGVNSTAEEFTAPDSRSMALALQLAFDTTIRLPENSALVAKPWSGKTLVNLGDSITWYNGKGFASGHKQFGTMAIGYQQYIADKFGCLLENRGISGKVMPKIYTEQVLPYSFTNTFAVTIMSGANDHRLNVLAGSVLPLNSAFDAETYAGALQLSVEKMLSDNNAIKIYLITPIRGYFLNGVGRYKGETEISRDYADVVKAVGKVYGLPVIDFYDSVRINAINSSYWLGDNPEVFTEYLLHPTNECFAVMGNIAAEQISLYKI